MMRFAKLILIGFLTILSLTVAATAQSLIPDFRYFATRDTDFYGADLDNLFDTDLPSCVRACSANTECNAFTFNSRSNACFPKRGVTERSAFAGAFSAVKLISSPSVIRAGETRRATLGFLGEEDLDRATRQGRELGLGHAGNGEDLETMLSNARDRRAQGNTVQAMAWTGAALALSDRADLWNEYARLLLDIETDNRNDRRNYQTRATSAAINGYLRGENEAGRATSMATLAEALESLGRGRDMIPALRLALSEQNRDDIRTTLDRAIGQYGFLVTDTSVESDSAAPRICARFSEPLVKAGVDYEPYVQTGDATLVVQVEDAQLCVDGVEHGQRYRLTLRQGLPAASGETLSKSVEVTQYVRDRSPGVSFPGRAYVLPKSANAALPVETVNTGKLDLTLRRVSDRNLLRTMQEEYFGRPLSQWQLESFSTDIAEEIWTGTAEVQSELNRDMTPRLPMGEAIAGQAPGIYALTARVSGANPDDSPSATQWFVLSDLGISTVSGTDGLHVSLRGLSDAQPREGVTLRLISRANAVLATATTDADGMASFEPGLTRGTNAAAPALLLAEDGDSDMGFLSLTDPAFDLSDRGVEGRAPAGPIDVFLTTDRGAYRAGETIHATVLSRDADIAAIEGLPLIAILTRPDGVEYSRLISDGGHLGGHVFDFPTGPAVPRGTWRLAIRTAPDTEPVASQTLLVEDFIPERIDYDLALADGPVRLGSTPTLTLDARYLFGAPGADLTVEGEAILTAATELEGWPGYRFGRHDEDSSPRARYFSGGRTDAQGKAAFPVELPDPASAERPQELTIIARVADGAARPVERRLTAPVLPDSPVIGIRPLFTDVLGQGQQARFNLIGLAPELSPQAMQVKWTLNRVETRYQWYQQYGNWNWEPTTRRTRIATGEASLSDVPLELAETVDWGEYELIVERIGGPYTASSVSFSAGWYGGGESADTPDRLEMSLDRADYTIGDTAVLRLVPRAPGTALISVVSNHVIARQVVELAEGASTVPLEVTEDWGTGAYVTATVLRPMQETNDQTPTRSLGIVHAAIAPGDKQLVVSIDAPDVARPRQSQDVNVTIADAPEGEEVWLTLAAVDLGILNLTGFESPDPSAYYFGQRRLGVEMRDIYGRLIDPGNGAMGIVRSGGDADQGARLQSPPPTQDLMAQFSGPVQVGLDGTAEVTIDLPAFNGTVRLMAVAWSRDAVGQAERDMTVRDPVVVNASVPRFLAPGDESRILLDVTHADGPTGQMRLTIENIGEGLNIGTAPAPFDLADKAKASFAVPVSASTVGDPSFDVVLTTPDGTTLRQTLRLPVRANDPVISQTRRFTLSAGDAFEFTSDVFAGMKPGTGKAVISAGPLARFDAPGLLDALDRYPYGCTEQVTSQAMPLLYLSSVAEATGLGTAADIDDRIDAAIARVLTRQSPNGAFGLWRAESGDFWLDAYVADFLSRARAEGHSVPDIAFRMAMDNLRNRINYAPDFDNGGEDVAYALLVLAREGAAAMGDLRYYADVKADDFATPLAVAQIGAALAAYGDQTRADAMFARAANRLARTDNDAPVWRADYGTTLRDSAAVLALATEAGSTAVDAEALTIRVTTSPERLSTQESAWSLMAAKALIDRPSGSGLRVNGAPVNGPFVEILEQDSADSLSLSTEDGQATEITLTTSGIPITPPDAGGTGYSIERSFYDLDGQPLDGDSFAVGERFVTVLRVTPFEGAEARLILDDALPAGIEIDNPNLLRSGDIGALGWLDLSEAEHSEFRSDRFVSAVDMRNTRPVTLAYIARAVTPGNFHHPAASVEDMYRPRYRARTATSQITVSE